LSYYIVVNLPFSIVQIIVNAAKNRFGWLFATALNFSGSETAAPENRNKNSFLPLPVVLKSLHEFKNS
jgi:hypothetical protein